MAATLQAARQRLRPILMTSLAFTLGVVPLMLARGASDSTQHAIGTGVFGGMISGTFLAIFFVPVFFIVVARFIEHARKGETLYGITLRCWLDEVNLTPGDILDECRNFHSRVSHISPLRAFIPGRFARNSVTQGAVSGL